MYLYTSSTGAYEYVGLDRKIYYAFARWAELSYAYEYIYYTEYIQCSLNVVVTRVGGELRYNYSSYFSPHYLSSGTPVLHGPAAVLVFRLDRLRLIAS